ncbi:MAG: hypothetical protein KBC84_04285 [Proteobacteria bacterium]|nr:hypothetical protein [Pseudomonadota bacterium]
MLSKRYYQQKNKGDISDIQFEARWLLSFSDLLFLLIAVFVLKLSMSTFTKPNQISGLPETNLNSNEVVTRRINYSGKYGEILWNALVSESELEGEELDFNLKEKISTIAKTFNKPEYQIILAYNQDKQNNTPDNIKSGFYNKLIRQLIDNGIDIENIFLTTDSSFNNNLLLDSSPALKKNNLINIVISRNQNTF